MATPKQRAANRRNAKRALRFQEVCFLIQPQTPEQEAANRSGFAVRKDLDNYLRYMTTHDRAYDRAAAAQAKHRAERRKAEHGFASQKRLDASEQRKAEMHPIRLVSAQLRLERDLGRSPAAGAGFTRLELAKWPPRFTSNRCCCMPLTLQLSPADELQRVAALARTGATEENIAAELQIPLKRLQKRYRREIERNRATAKNEMLAHLYESARSNNTAAMFWIRSQCGWRDTGPSPETTIVLLPIIEIGHRTPATTH
jgi:hypothetical protein